MRRLLMPIVLVIAAVVAHRALLPTAEIDGNRPAAFGDDPEVVAARTALTAIGDSLRQYEAALRRANARRLADSLGGGRAPFTTTVSRRVPRDIADGVLGHLERERRAVGIPQVPIRVHLDSGVEYGMYNRTAVLPSAVGEPCVSIVRVRVSRSPSPLAADDFLLGTCGFYARFGMPGPGMAQWLAMNPASAAVDTAIFPGRGEDRRERMRGGNIAYAPPVAACIAGRDDPCADALFAWGTWGFSARDVRRRGVVAATPGRTVVHGSGPDSRWIPTSTLARLRQHMGDSAFARVWRSELPPPDAYRAVTGEHIAEFVRPELLRDLEPHRAGPLPASLPIALGLLIGVLTAALAILRTPRARS